MIFSFIAPKWLPELEPFELDTDLDTALEYNAQGYNVYYFPNCPSDHSKLPINPRTKKPRFVKAVDIDTFDWVFADLDMKDYQSDNADRRHEYETKQAFIDRVTGDKIPPTMIVDSGNGIHVYWKVTDLDAMSFLLLTRRICRYFTTDPAVCNIKQLLRVPGTVNTKNQDSPVMCEAVHTDFDIQYTSEQLDKLLPAITAKDLETMQTAHDKAYNLNQEKINVAKDLPRSFLSLCRNNNEVKDLFYGEQEDRSIADFRLAHVLFSNGLSKEDMMSVLYNTKKASERAPTHRYSYALNIVEKAWEEAKNTPPETSIPIRTVKAIVDGDQQVEGTRFYCNPVVDATEGGFRLGHVLGMVAGSGVGKTTLGLNFAVWFTEYNVNSDYVHLIVSLEQPEREIADRWRLMSSVLKQQAPNVDWDSMLFILDNYNTDGTHRNLGWDDIEHHILEIQKVTGKKVGAVIVDHIGLVKQGKGIGEYDGLNGNAKRMKSVAVRTNTFMIVQSQTSRGKGGSGDVDLDIDAAFGASNFEWNADFILTVHQPLKRVYDRAPHMTVLAFKYAKIRKKNVLKDNIRTDVIYGLMFDPVTELLREMTGDELKAYDYWAVQASKERNRDKKRDAAPLKAVTWTVASNKVSNVVNLVDRKVGISNE